MTNVNLDVVAIGNRTACFRLATLWHSFRASAEHINTYSYIIDIRSGPIRKAFL